MADFIAPRPEGYRLARDGRLAEAEAWFRERLSASPDERMATYGLSVVLLAQGRYAEGADGYDLRHVVSPQPRPELPWPYWRGEDLSGKRLVIFPEQGFGDAIQFARFAPSLREKGADVTLLCHPALERLFANLGVRVVAAAGQTEFPDPDYWVQSNSLLRCAGAVADDTPGAAYLSATPRERGGIGVVGRGNPNHHNDANRSLPPELEARLLALPGARSLSPEVTGARDFQETADIIAGLDLVVTVDTSVAHLAGALGKPVWILLPEHNTDWRWMRGRSDTPWYLSARLYRQEAPGDWTGAIQRVFADL
jgi:hypothetical protein